MSATDDSLFRAVEELNRRMAQSHRRMTTAAVVAAVVAGGGSVAGLLVELGVGATGPYLLAASFLFTSLVTFLAGSSLSRVILSRLQGAWVSDLAGRFQADPAEVAGYALPLGESPPASGKGRPSRVKLVLAVLLVACSIVLVLSSPESAIFGIAAAVVSVTFVAAFNRYLGWRAPR